MKVLSRRLFNQQYTEASHIILLSEGHFGRQRLLRRLPAGHLHTRYAAAAYSAATA
jgi:hypothetical protein